MKKYLHALAATFWVCNLIAAQTTEKTLVSSINPNDHTALVIDVPGHVELEVWNGEVIKIQTTVSIENVSDAVLKSLVSAGRYKMVPTAKNDTLELSLPGLNKQVSLSGKPIIEKLAYLIFVPNNMTVEIMNNKLSDLPLAENNP